MREAPVVDIVKSLLASGATIRAYDPIAMEEAAPLLPEVKMLPNPYQMAEGCDILMVNTEWNEFRQLDLGQIRDAMKQPLIFDGRNIYDPEKMAELGFKYRGVGRGYDGRVGK